MRGVKQINFLNLSNGLEWLPDVDNYQFIRISSTACEQGRWVDIFDHLESNLLMNYALGNTCVIYDAGSRSGDVSRAQWQALPLIEWVLQFVWDVGPPDSSCMVKNMDCTKWALEVYNTLPKKVRTRLKYFKRYTGDEWDGLMIHLGCPSELDGKYDKLAELAREYGTV